MKNKNKTIINVLNPIYGLLNLSVLSKLGEKLIQKKALPFTAFIITLIIFIL